MAEVFLAEAVDDQGDTFQVALKLMKKDVSEEIFNNEADLMSLLSHPNLVQRLEIGTAFGRPFIAMEFLVGGDLLQLMNLHRRARRDFPLNIGLYIALEVLKGLGYFHQAKSRKGTPLGLVHGDVNPANIFLSAKGEVKLGDFGVAKSQSANIGPADGIAAGKLHYLSPEQTAGEPLGAASDLFALGIVLHELVVGFNPFVTKQQSDEAVMEAIRAAKIHLPDYIDKSLSQILKRALQADPDARFKTAGQFAGALLQYAIDRNLHPSPNEVRLWLKDILSGP
jgi:serine/threonine-protein kinase